MLSGVSLLVSLIGLCRFCVWGEESNENRAIVDGSRVFIKDGRGDGDNLQTLNS